ncbi:MAG: TIGR03767 family metallophosphoesterase [Fimbriimonadaceae bacterium]|nr:TIGR03767 family metallophosphoesterase [Fimbriimonadaceae bacterium]
MRSRAWVLAFSLVIVGCGGGTAPDERVAKYPQGTTLERSLTPTIAAGQGLKGTYYRLAQTPGWPLIVREELAVAKPDRRGRRKAIAAFVHLTDTHIIDSQSPARAPFLRKYSTGTGPNGINFADAFRAQEALSTYVSEAMVQRVNSLRAAPITGAELSFAVSTGDNGDGKGTIELQNYINCLDGGPVVSNTSGQGYVGWQDDYIFAPTDNSVSDAERQEIYGQYYHPNQVPSQWAGRIFPDDFKRDYGYPDHDGLLSAATQNFSATGLRMPWYSGNGNHDGLVQGNFNLEGGTLDLMDQLAEGTFMIMDLPESVSPLEFLECLETANQACIEKLLSESPSRTVPADPKRKIHSNQDFVQMHLNSPAFPGPVGHGFTQANLASGKLYYSFQVAPGVKGIMLDTVNYAGGADGSLGSIQAEWLEGELREVSSRYTNGLGQIVETGAANELVVIFSHHNLQTMENTQADPTDPIRLGAAEVEALLHRYPNVVLWVNGHSHINRVWSHADPTGRTPGFWELNTASHIDFPQQSRTVEIVDNLDGTLSIFGILLDHMAPSVTNAHGTYSILDIASISRELAANDPLIPWPNQIGAPSDRNVELVLRKPF